MEIVKKSNLGSLKSTFEGNSYNEHYYTIIQSVFGSQIGQLEFAKPIVLPSSSTIVWKANTLGPFKKLSDLKDEDLKNQLFQLIQDAIEILEQKSIYLSPNFISKITKIPSFDSVYYTEKNDLPSIVLTEWGYTNDDVDKSHSLLSESITTKFQPFVIKFENEDGKLVGIKCTIQTKSSTYQKVSNAKGIINLNNLEKGDIVKISNDKKIFQDSEIIIDDSGEYIIKCKVDKPIKSNTETKTKPSTEKGEKSVTDVKDHDRKLSRQIRNGVLLTVLFIGIVIGIFSMVLSFNSKENTNISNSRYIFGIDISQYQETINWNKVKKSHHPIKYIFIRSTMGVDGKDLQFNRNWVKAKAHNYVRGAYHYYRPNENSTLQFNNFYNSVRLDEGDFRPILDIEQMSIYGSYKLREGISNWLKLAEEKYGVKPMIYTGLTFYKNNLKGYFDDYPLWIAAYSGKYRLQNVDWSFHQFTDYVIINGINSPVDGNDFQGDWSDFLELCK